MIYSVDGRSPDLAPGSYVAPGADIIGSVRLGDEASVWFGAVVRGDNDWIDIGPGSNVQDGSVIHTDTGFPTWIGAGVSIGHQVLLHSCRVEGESLIGNGARILDRVTVGRHCVIAAGSLLPPGTVIPDGSVVMGSPGRIVRSASDQDLQMIHRAALSYRNRIRAYAQLQLWSRPVK